MAQELMAEADALRGAFDEAGDVRHDEGLAFAHGNDAQDRDDGGEVVVADDGLCLTDDRDEGGLADVWEPEQADVREELQLELQFPFFAGSAVLGKAGRLSRGRGEVPVAPAATTAAGRDEFLFIGHVGDDGVGLDFPDDGALRDLDVQVLSALSVALVAAAVLAVLGFVLPFVAEVGQGGEGVVDHKDDVSASAAVSAVGPAAGDVFFTVERDRSVAAFAGGDRDLRNIDKHKSVLPSKSFHDYIQLNSSSQ